MISRGLLVYGGVPYFKFGILLEKFYVIKVEWLSDEKWNLYVWKFQENFESILLLM